MITLIIVTMILLAIPLGRYISYIFKLENPIENKVLKLCGIDPKNEMTWKQNVRAMLSINFLWIIWAFVIVMTQKYMTFLNPDKIGSMTWHQAFNTAVSFVTNTNLQHYSGETGATYFTQLFVFCFLQFVSAGTGMACCALMFNALSKSESKTIGNFYTYLVTSCTRILLPLALIVATILVINGSPVTFEGAEKITTLEGKSVSVARGPVAPMIAIKQLGTNGGGYFAANSAHPFENPNALTNAVETISIGLIAIAMVFAFGFYIKKRKLSWVLFGTMLAFFLMLVIPTISIENHANVMEGKEVRFGTGLSALWGVLTTCTSNGSINAMHDSFSALSGMFLLLGMQLNTVFGGVGVGFLNLFVFLILAVFISGLMIGRTPEFLGKKIEGFEIKIAVLVTLLHPALILIGTALASFLLVKTPTLPWLTNTGFHGFSEMLYEFSSAAANNGSEFGGLCGNVPFFNVATGIVMLLGRYLPIIGPIAIVGSLAAKKRIPESAGTLKTDSSAFAIMLFSTILIFSALAFLPPLVLGPIADWLTH